MDHAGAEGRPNGVELGTWSVSGDARGAGRARAGRLEGEPLRGLAPSVSSLAHTEYVDNFIAMFVTEEPVKEVAELLDKEMARALLPTHGVEVSLGGAALGWEFAADTPSMAANPRRCWRLKLVIPLMPRFPC